MRPSHNNTFSYNMRLHIASTTCPGAIYWNSSVRVVSTLLQKYLATMNNQRCTIRPSLWTPEQCIFMLSVNIKRKSFSQVGSTSFHRVYGCRPIQCVFQFNRWEHWISVKIFLCVLTDGKFQKRLLFREKLWFFERFSKQR